MNMNIKKLNLNGQVCPMPAALTRKKLRTMNKGEKLEVFGDFDLAIENIIDIAQKNEAKIIEKESRKDFYRVLILKE